MRAYERDAELLGNLKAHWLELSQLLQEMNAHWVYEDLVYRFYHQSFKVYRLPAQTERMVAALRAMAPAGTTFCAFFDEIHRASAAAPPWQPEHNRAWTAHTRVLVEAFFHARFFLEMAVKYGQQLETPPPVLPSGWAALLSLYNLR